MSIPFAFFILSSLLLWLVIGAKGHWLIFAFAAALGQIIAKSILFLLFSCGQKVLPQKYNDKMLVLKKHYEAWGPFGFILKILIY